MYCGKDFGNFGYFSERGSWYVLQERDLPEVSRWGDGTLSSGKLVCLEWFPGGDFSIGIIGYALKLRTPPKYAALRLAWEAYYVVFDVDNKNPDSSPVSVIWERNYRACILQQRYTFCFNSLILYRVSVRGTNCTPHQFSIDQVQKHSETALDTPKKEDTESSFPMKMHAIVHH